MSEISTIEELIDFLGGDTALATDLGLSQPAVGNWKVRREIPSGWHLKLLAMAMRRGARVDLALFGLSTEEAAALASSLPPRSSLASQSAA